MGGRGLIEDQLNKVFLSNLCPTLDSWIEYGNNDRERTKKALLRYTLGHLVAELDGDDTPCYPEEVYLSPPLENTLTTGSIVKKSDGTHHVVMTPACDLVTRNNGNTNVNSIILAEIVPEETVHKDLKANSDTKKKLKKNNHKLCFHWLPSMAQYQLTQFPGGYVDFRKILTVPRDSLESDFEHLEMRIAPSFIKDIVARFSLYYGRQGQPDIEPR